MPTNVPAIQFTSAGPVAPTESAIKAGVWKDFQQAFGGGLNESDATPQGQLVASLTAIIAAGNDQMLQYINLTDPAFSSGRMQDGIGRLSYIDRIAATSTIVECTCTGAAGTVIEAGALAQASDGTIYQSLGAATIPIGGSVSVTFAAIDTGPIACPSGTLTRIMRVVSGWDTITNPAAGVIGRDVESAAEFEARRTASVAKNAVAVLQAIRGTVLAVPGVIDAYVTENPTGTSTTVGSVTIAANSVYVAAWGGTDADVARAIWSKKSPGCAYNGNTTVTVEDTSYSLPYPSYNVTFERPSALPIYFAVTIANNGAVPADAQTQIRDAIAFAFAGGDGGPKARIGGTLYALRFASAVSSLGSWAQLVSIKIGTSASPTGDNVAVGINEMPTLDPAYIAVALA
ncbi:baseplate J/gp47 family protein [Novosphingobium sp.]|uniref:baseplate J/gp47 family protein n=1 Tax=Novosphingobium sp. TaxID=1874826 RepID=UPI003529FEA8